MLDGDAIKNLYQAEEIGKKQLKEFLTERLRPGNKAELLKCFETSTQESGGLNIDYSGEIAVVDGAALINSTRSEEYIHSNLRPIEKNVIVTIGDNALCWPNQDTTLLHPCNHEEADTRMFLHLADAINRASLRKAVIYTVDTDVVVLAVNAVARLKDLGIKIAFGSQQNFKVIDANLIFKSIGYDKARVITMFHALTGCYTVSFFHSKGKKTAMAAWNMVNDVNGPFLRIMQQPDYIREEDMNTIEQFVVVMYDKTSQSSNVNEARLQLFAKKSRSLENIPPTKAALEQHVRRAALQANCWEQMFKPSLTLPQPDKCGWISVDGTWQPKLSDLPEEQRGISGGQRKRVNIGMELIADPTLLFLDEPTSGLDSTSSLTVLNALRKVAEKGRLTVACVIHQPRYEIFRMFHNILLLAPGGRTVYQGSVPDAETYFASLGFVIPEHANPADFYMDVIGGATGGNFSHDPEKLPHYWIEKRDSFGATSVKVAMAGSCGDCGKEFRISDRPEPNMFSQFFSFLIREFILQFRQIKTVLLDTFLVLLAGGVLGSLYREVKLNQFLTMTTMSGMGIGLVACIPALRVFGQLRPVFWREASVGINRFSYFMAGNVSQLPQIALMPIIYLSLQYTFTAPRGYLNDHYLVSLAAWFGVSGFGYLISCVFNPRNAQMATVLFILVSSLLSGSSPTLCKMNDLKVIGPAFYSLSYARWYVEALFEAEVKHYAAVHQNDIDYFAFNRDYALDKYWVCVGVLFGYGSSPTLCKMNDLKVIGPAFYSLSYARWYVEALFEAEVKHYAAVHQNDIDYFAFNRDYALDKYWVCVGVLFGYGFVTRIIAFLCLIFMNRGKQQ
eukprot:gene12948-3707_t